MGVSVSSALEIFTLYCYDLNTGTKLTELPAKGLSFDTRLNDPGAISFSIDLKSPNVAARAAALLAYDGFPVACYVDLNGNIVWGGIIWTTNYQKSTGELSYGGREFLSWGDQRAQAADYSDKTYPSGLDPAVLIFDVFTDAQNPAISGDGASIGLQITSSTTSIPPVVPGYPLLQRTTISRILADMTQIISPGVGGVDVTVTSQWDTNGNPLNTLTVWSPRVGRAAGDTGLIFDLSNALDYTWPQDATQSGTTLFVTGAGNGAATPSATVQVPGLPVGGLGQPPRLDKVLSYSQVQSQQQISLMAAGAAQQFGRPLNTPTVTIPTLGVLGSWLIGDDARIRTSGDERFPNGLDEFWRIVQSAVTVPDEGVPTVTLTLNNPPVF